MTILLTNDDGVLSGGIYALFETLSKEHTVYCIAPLKNKSGASSAITVDARIYYQSFSSKIFGAACYPADCVNLGFMGLLPEKPTLVIAGINRGANYGCDIQYSGTVGAAMQAGRFGIPGFALSLCSDTAPFYFEAAAQFFALHLREFLEFAQPGFFVNVNMPNQAHITSFKTSYATKTDYTIWAREKSSSSLIKDSSLSNEYEEDSDRSVVSDGHVAVSVLPNKPTRHYAGD